MVSGRCVVSGDQSLTVTLENEAEVAEKLAFRPGQAVITTGSLQQNRRVGVNADPLSFGRHKYKRVRFDHTVFPLVTPTCQPPGKGQRVVGLAVTALPDPRLALYFDSLAVIGVATHGLIYAEIDSGLDGTNTVYGGGVFCNMRHPGERATLEYDFDGHGRISDTFQYVGFLVSVVKKSYCAIFLTLFTDLL